MGTIVISENVSLDGVMQDPTGEEGFRLGGWFTGLGEADRAAWAGVFQDEAMRAEALLMGRRSDQWFAERWLSRTGEWAERLNSMPRYIVSSTLDEAAWTGATVLRGDVVAEVSRLRDSLAGEIVVNGSTQLVRTLLENDLADELRLMVFPAVLGAGDRVFDAVGAAKRLRLTGTRAVGENLALLTYDVVREP